MPEVIRPEEQQSPYQAAALPQTPIPTPPSSLASRPVTSPYSLTSTDKVVMVSKDSPEPEAQ